MFDILFRPLIYLTLLFYHQLLPSSPLRNPLFNHPLSFSALPMVILTIALVGSALVQDTFYYTIQSFLYQVFSPG